MPSHCGQDMKLWIWGDTNIQHIIHAKLLKYSSTNWLLSWKSSLSRPVMFNCLWPYGLSLSRISVHGILQARILDWDALSFSKGSSQPGIKPWSPSLQAGSLPSEPPGKLASILISKYFPLFSQVICKLARFHHTSGSIVHEVLHVWKCMIFAFILEQWLNTKFLNHISIPEYLFKIALLFSGIKCCHSEIQEQVNF